MTSLLRFFTWPTIAGILAAIIILDRLVPTSAPQPAAQDQRVSFSGAVRRASPSVVNIYTSKTVQSRPHPLADDPFLGRLAGQRGRQRERVERSLGSGVIMSETGYILTNDHVISGAEQILVAMQDGRESLAYLIGVDKDTDLAVLKIDLPNVEPISLAHSGDTRVGDVVLAIGNPLGFGHSVSQGIVSALGRYGLQANTYEDYIQTDATINPGNSGGALIDSRGRLVGINSLIYTPTGSSIGIGLATPVEVARLVLEDIIEHGRVIRGWLGVSVQPAIASDGTTAQRLVVLAVATDSPAERAGVQAGDLIRSIDGNRVLDGRQTMLDIARLRPGESLAIQLQRGTEIIETTAIVGIRPQPNG